MKPRRPRRILGTSLLILSAAALAWSIWPFGQGSQSLTFAGGSHRLTVLWPEIVRAGELRQVALILEPVTGEGEDQLNEAPSGPNLGSTATVPGAPGNGHVLAEARLEMMGILVSPSEQVSQPWPPDKRVTFRWAASPAEAGEYEGVLWLNLRFIPQASGQERETPILARNVQIRAVELFGLGGHSARYLGVLGVLVGVLLGLDGFYLNPLKSLWRHNGPSKSGERILAIRSMKK